MKKVSILSLIALFAIVVSSCGSSNNVVSNHGISKRKYNKGFFFQRKSNLKTANTKVKDAEFDGSKTLAKTEKVKAKKVASKKSKVATRKNTLENSNIAKAESTHLLEKTVINEEVQETQHFLYEGEDGIESSVTENQPSAIDETNEEISYENRDQTAKKRENNSNGSDSDLIFILAVIFAILIPPLGVAIYTNIDWMKVLIALLLTILFFLPGMIYALLVVFDVI